MILTNLIQARITRLAIIAVPIVSGIFLSPIFSNAQTTSINVDGSHPNNKVVILTFGDTIKTQLTDAKPILDKYGLKGTFFCYLFMGWIKYLRYITFDLARYFNIAEGWTSYRV
jgi:hypothetical protein